MFRKVLRRYKWTLCEVACGHCFQSSVHACVWEALLPVIKSVKLQPLILAVCMFPKPWGCGFSWLNAFVGVISLCLPFLTPSEYLEAVVLANPQFTWDYILGWYCYENIFVDSLETLCSLKAPWETKILLRDFWCLFVWDIYCDGIWEQTEKSPIWTLSQSHLWGQGPSCWLRKQALSCSQKVRLLEAARRGVF